MHKIRIKDKDFQIYVDQGKGVKVGLFKGTLISTEEEEPAPAPPPGPEEKTETKRSTPQPTPEQRQKGLTGWEFFVDGALPLFR